MTKGSGPVPANGNGNGHTSTNGAPAAATLTLTNTAVIAKSTSEASAKSDAIYEARLKGYEGESCRECGNFTLVRNGTCMKCNTCGATSGCS